MIVRTFDASGESRVMIQEKHVDADGRVTFERIFDEEGHSDREYTYDPNGHLTEVLERGEEGETYRKTFAYHPGGSLATEILWIGGQPYRRIEHATAGDTETTTTYEGDHELERREATHKDGKTQRVDYFEEGVLAESQLYTYPAPNTVDMEVLEGDGQPFGRRLTTHNEEGDLLTLRRWQEGNLMESVEQTFNDQGLLLRQVVGEYDNGITEYTLDYKYDAHGNLTEREWREQSSGQLIGFEHNRYDDQHRLVETVGKMHSVALGGTAGGEQHLVYGYEE